MNLEASQRPKPIFRRSSTGPPAAPATSSVPPNERSSKDRSRFRVTDRYSATRKSLTSKPVPGETGLGPHSVAATAVQQHQSSFGHSRETYNSAPVTPQEIQAGNQYPKVIVERPTPERGRSIETTDNLDPSEAVGHLVEPAISSKRASKQTLAARRHSPIHAGNNRLFSNLYRIEEPIYRPAYVRQITPSPQNSKMPHRKVWVKRTGSSPTQVTIGEDDLVDDVRDMVIRKYANSLGRTFDSPDVSLRLVQRKYSARHSNHERLLGPEEVISKIIDVYYPGGQTIEEALIIDVPQRRTPKHSPRLALPYYMADNVRPGENGSDYFPPMAVQGPHSPQMPLALATTGTQPSLHRPTPHSISVLETGQVPDLPSPGSRLTRHSHRPRNARTHTTSPTIVSGSSSISNLENLKAPTAQPMHTPPIPSVPSDHTPRQNITPPPRTSSPRPSKNNKRPRKSQPEKPLGTTSSIILDNAVPPINVLIVEDNIINLRLLEAFLKRLKVRWSTAMNGRDAVASWRKGGFHLVLMDIQLPVMNGLDATKEIRRLERVNDIGIVTDSGSSTPTISPDEKDPEANMRLEKKEGDTLENLALFKSSVIIVALTASSLQSDRHEALAAGCNDFLTKPVSFDWLSRKVMEWGCMQALIDFDGWRKWKDLSSSTDGSKKDVSSTKANSTAKNASKTTQDNAHSSPNNSATTTKTPISPTVSKSNKSPANATAFAAPSPLPSVGSANPSSNGGPGTGNTGKTKKPPLLNGKAKDRLNDRDGNVTTSDETGTGTDTNGEEGSGAEITVGA